jgi:hypothetical protein
MVMQHQLHMAIGPLHSLLLIAGLCVGCVVQGRSGSFSDFVRYSLRAVADNAAALDAAAAANTSPTTAAAAGVSTADLQQQLQQLALQMDGYGQLQQQQRQELLQQLKVQALPLVSSTAACVLVFWCAVCNCCSNSLVIASMLSVIGALLLC